MDLSNIKLKGPEWAQGCESCSYGVVLAPETTGAVEFYLERLVQAIDGDITFCTCQAGVYYHSSLKNRWRKLIEDAKRDTRMVESARDKTHPDIENARIAIAIARGKRVPTVHAEKVPA